MQGLLWRQTLISSCPIPTYPTLGVGLGCDVQPPPSHTLLLTGMDRTIALTLVSQL